MNLITFPDPENRKFSLLFVQVEGERIGRTTHFYIYDLWNFSVKFDFLDVSKALLLQQIWC